MRREYAKVPREVVPGRRHDRRKTRNEGERASPIATSRARVEMPGDFEVATYSLPPPKGDASEACFSP